MRFTASHRRGWEGTWGNDFLDFGVRTSLRTSSCPHPPLPVLLPLNVLPTSVTDTTHHQVAQAASLRFSLNSPPPLTPGSNLPNTSQAPPLPLHSTWTLQRLLTALIFPTVAPEAYSQTYSSSAAWTFKPDHATWLKAFNNLPFYMDKNTNSSTWPDWPGPCPSNHLKPQVLPSLSEPQH